MSRPDPALADLQLPPGLAAGEATMPFGPELRACFQLCRQDEASHAADLAIGGKSIDQGADPAGIGDYVVVGECNNRAGRGFQAFVVGPPQARRDLTHIFDLSASRKPRRDQLGRRWRGRGVVDDDDFKGAVALAEK